MKKSFTGALLSGHKQNAVELPFNPAAEWKMEAQTLWRGRRAFPVRSRIKGHAFDNSIAPRQKDSFC
jgi:hypothetical protein